jgi:integral membrane protein
MAAHLLDVHSVESALLRYRIVALIVSVLLVLLFFVGVPLQVFANQGGVDNVVGVAHGVFFYPLYLLLTLDLARRVRMTPIQTVLTMLAGTIPIASFYAERRTTQYIRTRQATLEQLREAPGQASEGGSATGGGVATGDSAVG